MAETFRELSRYFVIDFAAASLIYDDRIFKSWRLLPLVRCISKLNIEECFVPKHLDLNTRANIKLRTYRLAAGYLIAGLKASEADETDLAWQLVGEAHYWTGMIYASHGEGDFYKEIVKNARRETGQKGAKKMNKSFVPRHTFILEKHDELKKKGVIFKSAWDAATKVGPYVAEFVREKEGKPEFDDRDGVQAAFRFFSPTKAQGKSLNKAST